MKSWEIAIQHLLDWIDEHAIENPSLSEISTQVGYSPYYLSEQFRQITGGTIKVYMAKRRLTLAALAIRDTNIPLLDIALDYGFSTHSALTRAFVEEFGCSPAVYRNAMNSRKRNVRQSKYKF